jgi:hypothetical protein
MKSSVFWDITPYRLLKVIYVSETNIAFIFRATAMALWLKGPEKGRRIETRTT